MTFKQPEDADVCIATVHGRWFAGQRLEANHWDGKTKFLIQETEEEMEVRLKQWHSFIEEDLKKSSSNLNKKDTKTASENDTISNASDGAIDETASCNAGDSMEITANNDSTCVTPHTQSVSDAKEKGVCV